MIMAALLVGLGVGWTLGVCCCYCVLTALEREDFSESDTEDVNVF